MQIAPYFEKVIKQAEMSLESKDAVSFIGIAGCGRSFLYSVLAKRHLKPTNIYIDLAGTNGKTAQIEKVLITAVSNTILKIPNNKISIQDFFLQLETQLNDNKTLGINLIIHTGYNETVNEELLMLLSTTAYKYFKKLNYIFFACFHNLHKHASKNDTLNSLLTSHIVPVKPLDKQNTKFLINDFETSYKQKINDNKKELIFKYSGGNPGLIKAFYLQIINNDKWVHPDYTDLQLTRRLDDILNELNEEQLKAICGVEIDVDILNELKYYGYLNSNNEVFSLALIEYISRKNMFGTKTIEAFSTSQRKLFEYFELHANTILTRQDVANVLWNDMEDTSYSDWALDRFISNFRKALDTTKLKRKLETKKGEGYIYIK